jgi:hypothetical protein
MVFFKETKQPDFTEQGCSCGFLCLAWVPRSITKLGVASSLRSRPLTPWPIRHDFFECNPLHKWAQHSTVRSNQIQPVTKSLDTQKTAQNISIINANTTSIKCSQHSVESVYFWLPYIFRRNFFWKFRSALGTATWDYYPWLATT